MPKGSGLAVASLAAAEVAAAQWGFVTSAQLTEAGVNPTHVNRLVSGDVLERVHHGVYRLVRFPTSPLDDLRAAWIGADRVRSVTERLDGSEPLVVVSHASAAAVFDAGDLAADEHELTTRVRKRLSIPDVRVHVDRSLDRGDWTVVDGILVTTPSRTVEDLIAAGGDAEHLGVIMRDFLQRDLLQADELVGLLDAHGPAFGRRRGEGQAILDDLLEQVGVSGNAAALASHSVPSIRLAQQFESLGGLEAVRKFYTPEMAELLGKVVASTATPDVTAQMNALASGVMKTVSDEQMKSVRNAVEGFRNAVTLNPEITDAAARLSKTVANTVPQLQLPQSDTARLFQAALTGPSGTSGTSGPRSALGQASARSAAKDGSSGQS